MEEMDTNNELKNLISYSDKGKVLLCQSGPDDSLRAEQEESEYNTIFSDEAAESEKHFIDLVTLKVKSKGDKPNEGYVFDYDSSQWVFNIAEAK